MSSSGTFARVNKLSCSFKFPRNSFCSPGDSDQQEDRSLSLQRASGSPSQPSPISVSGVWGREGAAGGPLQVDVKLTSPPRATPLGMRGALWARCPRMRQVAGAAAAERNLIFIFMKCVLGIKWHGVY